MQRRCPLEGQQAVIVEQPEQPLASDTWRWAVAPVLIALVLIAVIWLRYDNSWAENDTVTLTRAARGVLREGTVSPERDAYDHGYGFPTLLATLSLVAGLPVSDIQVLVLPWLTIITA